MWFQLLIIFWSWCKFEFTVIIIFWFVIHHRFVIARLWNYVMVRGNILRCCIDRFGGCVVVWRRTWFQLIFLWTIWHWSRCVHWVFYFFGHRVRYLYWDWDFYLFFTHLFDDLCALLLIRMFIHYFIISFTLLLKCLDALLLRNIDSGWVTFCHHLSSALRHYLCPVLHFVHGLTLRICDGTALLPHSGLKPRIFTLFNWTCFLTSCKYKN